MIHPTAKASREPIAAAFSSQYDKRGWGTEDSNPSLSTGESGANLTQNPSATRAASRERFRRYWSGIANSRKKFYGGTDGSNPSPSSAESGANLIFGGESHRRGLARAAHSIRKWLSSLDARSERYVFPSRSRSSLTSRRDSMSACPWMGRTRWP
jgi:hypothetical protein